LSGYVTDTGLPLPSYAYWYKREAGSVMVERLPEASYVNVIVRP
jgi:hypothetical protein